MSMTLTESLSVIIRNKSGLIFSYFFSILLYFYLLISFFHFSKQKIPKYQIDKMTKQKNRAELSVAYVQRAHNAKSMALRRICTEVVGENHIPWNLGTLEPLGTHCQCTMVNREIHISRNTDSVLRYVTYMYLTDFLSTVTVFQVM